MTVKKALKTVGCMGGLHICNGGFYKLTDTGRVTPERKPIYGAPLLWGGQCRCDCHDMPAAVLAAALAAMEAQP